MPVRLRDETPRPRGAARDPATAADFRDARFAMAPGRQDKADLVAFLSAL